MSGGGSPGATMRERLHWLALHGVVRVAAGWAARRGDPQARLMADPAVRADPVSFYDEVRAMGPTVRTQVGYLTLALSLGTQAGLEAGLLHLGAQRPEFRLDRPRSRHDRLPRDCLELA